MLNATLYTSWYFLICQRHCPIICTIWDPDPGSVYLLIWNNLPNNPCHRPGNVHGCLKSTFHETRLENSACLLAEVLTWAPMANEGRHAQCTTWVNVVLLVTRNTPRTSSGKKLSLAKEQPDGQSLHRRFASRDLTTLHLLSIFSLAHRASTLNARDERHSKNILRWIIMDAK